MMSKRFAIVGEEYVGYMQGNAYIISNGECKFSLWERREDAQKVCDYLNKQQDTIRRLQDLCGESDGENAKLRIENKKLQEEIKLLKPTNIEQYEQIQKLQEENEQLRQSVEHWQKKYEEGTETFTLLPNCDECDFLGNNGICGYCKFTLKCYDSKEDLIDGEVLPNCPLKPLINVLNGQQSTISQLQDLCGESDGENAKLRIENKKLKEELNDCEKFRYTVFKKLNEEYIKERSIK